MSHYAQPAIPILIDLHDSIRLRHARRYTLLLPRRSIGTLPNGERWRHYEPGLGPRSLGIDRLEQRPMRPQLPRKPSTSISVAQLGIFAPDEPDEKVRAMRTLRGVPWRRCATLQSAGTWQFLMLVLTVCASIGV